MAQKKICKVRGNFDHGPWAEPLPLTEVVEAGGLHLYFLHLNLGSADHHFKPTITLAPFKKVPAFIAGIMVMTAASVPAADFAFGIEGCPARLCGVPGEVKSFDAFVTLTTSNNAEFDGAQGWSLSVCISGGVVKTVSLKGVHVSTIYDQDDDGDPDTPPITQDPFDQDLGGPEVFTKIANKATFKDDPSRVGVISAVVLRSQEKMVLQPNGVQTILKLVVEVTIPAVGEAAVTFAFEDGFKSSVSQPVNNVVTFGGASVRPAFESCVVQVCPVDSGEFHVAIVDPGHAAPESGDYVLVRNEQPGDVIVPVDVLLSSPSLPASGDGPQSWSLSIGHDSCMTVNKVTLKGVMVSTIYCQDEDGDPGTSCVVHDPFEQNLGAADVFTKIANKATGTPPSPINDPNQQGVISAVVLRSQEKMVLHPNATDTVLRIEYKISVEAGNTTNCRAFFLNGLKSSVSQPVNNVITYRGASIQPAVQQGIVIHLVPVEPPPRPGAPFKSGDANNDGRFDIADAVKVVMAVVPGMGPVLACFDSGDVNGDGRLDLTDAMYIIDWQFRQGPLPAAPFPVCAQRESVFDTTCPSTYVCTQ